MLDIQGLKQDPMLMKCGRAVEYGRNNDGTARRFWVRPFGSAYESRISALRRAAGEQACKRDNELDKECQVRACAELILCRRDENGNNLDAWEGFQDSNGATVPPTLENKMDALRGGKKGEDPDTYSRQFFIDCVSVAGEMQTFVAEEKEAAAENLKPALPIS